MLHQVGSLVIYLKRVVQKRGLMLLLIWRWTKQARPKHLYLNNNLHGVIFWNNYLFISNAVKMPDLAPSDAIRLKPSWYLKPLQVLIKLYSHQLMHFFIQLCISLISYIKITLNTLGSTPTCFHLLWVHLQGVLYLLPCRCCWY